MITIYFHHISEKRNLPLNCSDILKFLNSGHLWMHVSSCWMFLFMRIRHTNIFVLLNSWSLIVYPVLLFIQCHCCGLILVVSSSALHLAVMQGRLNNVRILLTESNIDAEAFNLRSVNYETTFSYDFPIKMILVTLPVLNASLCFPSISQGSVSNACFRSLREGERRRHIWVVLGVYAWISSG